VAIGPDVAGRAGGRGGTAWRRGALLSGGSDGNERLTVTTGAVLLVLLAVIGVTILRIRQLTFLHLFVGLLLIGPVALKLASTGYRFVRYYTHDPVYRRKGPPQPILRGIAPLVVISTLAVFVSGVVLLFLGFSSRGPWVQIHQVSTIVWVAFTGLHVLGHLPEMSALLPGGRRAHAALRAQSLRVASDGQVGRGVATVGALVGGVVLALVLVPDFGAWTHAGAFIHHHHH
jgi:hypothetical protein